MNKLILSFLVVASSVYANEEIPTYALQKTGEVNFLQEGDIYTFKKPDSKTLAFKTTLKLNPADLKQFTSNNQLFAVVEGHPYLLTKNLGQVDFSDVFESYSKIYPDFHFDDFDAWLITDEGRVLGMGMTKSGPMSQPIRIVFFYDPLNKNQDDRITTVTTGKNVFLGVNEKGDLLMGSPMPNTPPMLLVKEGKNYNWSEVK